MKDKEKGLFMYQFIRVESYARSVKSGATASDIAKEAERHPDHVAHIIKAGFTPQPPTYVYGCTQSQAVERAEHWAAQAKDKTGRRLRSDAPVILSGVISYPRDGEEWFSFKRAAVRWLKQHYGDNLVTIVEHQDEKHPHLHFYVVNPDGGNVKDLHPGFRAAKGAQTPKEQRLAYNTAMRAFQDRFWEHVAGPSGLARLGPGRQRMSRAQWTRVKFGLPAQAALLQRAREITRGTGERDRQLRAFAQKTMLEAKALMDELEAREARVLALEAKYGSSEPPTT